MNTTSDPYARYPTASQFYERLTGDEDARACLDIPDSACVEQPRNFLLHLFAFTATKIGDEIASARLVLPWLLASAGAPVWVTGWLVPIRESGALLPQLAVAGYLRRAAVRKWFWVAGSLLQAAALFGMVFVALFLYGAAAGWAVLGLLSLFSLARGICSVASKDVLGKTVSKRRRGTLMGLAGSLSGIATLGVGLALLLRDPAAWALSSYVLLLSAAAGLWALAALSFALLAEQPGATSGGANALGTALRGLRLLATDRPFRRFVITRALLVSTSLAIPFFVLLAGQNLGGARDLGLLLLASGAAALLSGRFWGRWADRSSRRVMMAAAALSGLLCAGVAVSAWLDGALFASGWPPALMLFVLALAHGGVRLGRKTYLVDMAGAETRALYVALSNTLIGGFMLLSGLFGLLAQWLGLPAVLLILALLAFAGTAMAWRLPEVQS